jgi:hypothetical protein
LTKMAPPEQSFPLSELEQRVHFVTKNFKEKSRKLPKDFDLKRDCELFELVQYSCTTQEQLAARQLADPNDNRGIECFPFVRLFRRYENSQREVWVSADSSRCGKGSDMFHVETTAWEGQYAYKPNRVLEENVKPETAPATVEPAEKEGKWFWSKW